MVLTVGCLGIEVQKMNAVDPLGRLKAAVMQLKELKRLLQKNPIIVISDQKTIRPPEAIQFVTQPLISNLATLLHEVA